MSPILTLRHDTAMGANGQHAVYGLLLNSNKDAAAKYPTCQQSHAYAVPIDTSCKPIGYSLAAVMPDEVEQHCRLTTTTPLVCAKCVNRHIACTLTKLFSPTFAL